jgi:hypothetical protein
MTNITGPNISKTVMDTFSNIKKDKIGGKLIAATIFVKSIEMKEYSILPFNKLMMEGTAIAVGAAKDRKTI